MIGLFCPKQWKLSRASVAGLKYLSHDVTLGIGDTYARLTLHGPLGRDTIDAIVEPGVTFTEISSSAAQKIGFKGRREVDVILANGERARRLLGSLEIELASQRDVVPVTIGEDGGPGIVGYTTLEILGFKVDPVARRLAPSPPIGF